LTAVKRRRASASDPISIEFDDLEKKGVSATVDRLALDGGRLPPPFDFERLTRFMAYGFLMAPVQHHWFSFLEAAMPLDKGSATAQALKRVALDQLIMAPVGTSFPGFLGCSGGLTEVPQVSRSSSSS
jgi:protein Mpv17